MNRPRVLLADDHTLILEAFRKLLEPHCDIVGTATDGRELLAIAPGLQPDVVVLDIAMPNLNGLDAARRLQRCLPGVRVIFLTVSEEPEMVAEAFDSGARGYLLKSSAAAELFQAIQTVTRDGTYVTPLVQRGGDPACSGESGRKRRGKLTHRQREVLQLLAEGRTMNEVAKVLHLTPRTVAYHKYRMMDELELQTNSELIQYAVRHGLVS